jgi:hypothetical protein
MWPLLACEYGLDCTAENNMLLLMACSNEGICDMPTLEEFVFARRFDADDKAQYQRLKPVLVSAFKSRDWSKVQFRLGADTLGTTALFNGFRTPLSPARW